MDDSRNEKAALVDGAVRPSHVIWIIFLALAIGAAGTAILTKGESATFAPIGKELLASLISATVILAFVVIVPEFRRSLGALFGSHQFSRSHRDLLFAFALMLCWGYGVYRFAICLPLMLAYPRAYEILRFLPRLDAFEPRYILFAAGTVVIAPVAEELLFRGYLMNLWIARSGTWTAVLLSSIVFGLFHLERALFAAPLGLVFALVYLKYGSLWPGIALHAAYNVLAFPWLLGQFFYVKQKASIDQLSAWSAELILTLVFIPLAFAFWRRFAPRKG